MASILACVLILWAMVVWGLWFSRSRTSRLLGANFIAVQIAAITFVVTMIVYGLTHTRLPPLLWITGFFIIIAATAMIIEIKNDLPRPR